MHHTRQSIWKDLKETGKRRILGIPKTRIVCPAMAYNFIFDEWNKSENPCPLREPACCYHCRKYRSCPRSNGCRSRSLENYPEKCVCYPLTWANALRIIFFVQIFNKAVSNKWSYIKFSSAVKKFIEEKKHDKEKKEWRKK